MDQGLVALILVAVIAVGGSLLQTFKPDVISPATSNALSAMTLALVGIVVSVNLLRLGLTLNAREGFQGTSPVDEWASLASEFKIQEVCDLYADIYEKIRVVEKGAPPDEVLSDAQSREKTDKIFSEVMAVSPIPCGKVTEALASKTEVELLETLLVLPDALLVQVYESALACRSLLIRSVNRIEDAERRAKEEQEKREEEGFEDAALCTPQQSEERREAAKKPPVSEEAQRCQLPEEVPKEKQEDLLKSKLNQFRSTFQAYQIQKKVKESLPAILDDCRFWKARLDAKKKEAEDKSNSYVFR